MSEATITEFTNQNVLRELADSALQIYKEGYIEITGNGSFPRPTVSVEHNLGYIPSHLAFAREVTTPAFPVFSPNTYHALPLPFTIDVEITDKKIIFTSFTGALTTLRVYYFIFREKI